MTDPIARLKATSTGTLIDLLGIELLELSAERVTARMPVERRVHQPFGLLHGGASVVLAETVASVGANAACPPGHVAVGLEINANHVRSVRAGVVTATATPLHVGGRTQIWEIRIVDERDRLVCASRCTLAVVPQASGEADAAAASASP